MLHASAVPLSFLTPLLAACTATAWWLARRSPGYRPVAALLTWAVASDLARAALQALALRPARAAGQVPYAGLVAAVFHIEQAILLFWVAALPVAALAVFRARRLWPPVAAWAVLSVVFAAAYPWLRLERRNIAHAVVHAAALLETGSVVWGSLRERWHRPSPWPLERWVIIGVWLVELTVAAVVWWWPEPGEHWGIARRVQAVGYLPLLCYQVWRITR